MSEELLVIGNPRGRRRRRNARGQFVSGRTHRRRRRNPIAANPRRRRRRRRNPIAAIAANPRRRRRRNPVALANPRHRRRRRTNPRYTHWGTVRRHRRRTNPRFPLSPRGLMNALIPAGTGALGAIGLEVAMSYVPLPAQFQTPLWKNVARLIGAFGIGYVASYVVGRERAKQVTLGALTVLSYSAIKELIAQNFPQLGLSGTTQCYDMSDLQLGYTNPAAMLTSARQNGMGAYMRSSMPTPAPGVGAYMRDSLDTVNSLNGVVSDGM